MQTFNLSCCHLLEKYPLYRVRTEVASSEYRLQILLIGEGKEFDLLFHKLIANGQLLDTELSFAILTSDAKQKASKLLEMAPMLKDYAVIEADNKKVSDNCQENYVNIRYISQGCDRQENLELIGSLQQQGYHYVVISTGDDQQNREYAGLCADILTQDSLIAYVQSENEPKAIQAKAEVFSFGYQNDSASLEQLELIAYNLHYAYSKSQNDRISNEVIGKTFVDEYNYVSNLEAAVHIRSKLASCGIDTPSLAEAADRFAELIKTDPKTVDRLAELEHRRWMMEKVLKGYRQLKDLNRIYGGRNISTHNSSEKWHVCLVPCNENSQLLPGDWDRPEGEYREELDPLDRITLMVHEKCGQLSEKNRQATDDLLKQIQDYIHTFFEDNSVITVAEHSMKLAISQMYQKKKSAIAIYEGNKNAILNEMESEGTFYASFLTQLLMTLDSALRPLKEYISYKDYKSQDRLFITQIPFALTHKKNTVIMKLLAEKEMDCLFSTFQLVPEKTIFLDMITSHQEYQRFRNVVEHISLFIRNSYQDIPVEYHMIVPEGIASAEDFGFVEGIVLHVVNTKDQMQLMAEINRLLEEYDPDYIDITNGDDKLKLPFFMNQKYDLISHQDGKISSIRGAEELTYPAPDKAITVQEMFHLSGSILKEESDSSLLSDLSTVYKEFFRIAFREQTIWAKFCNTIWEECKKLHKIRFNLPAIDRSMPMSRQSIIVRKEAVASLKELLIELEKKYYISDIVFTNNAFGFVSITFSGYGEDASKKLAEILQQCAEAYIPTTFFKMDNKKKTIQCLDLLMKDLNLPGEQNAVYRQILCDFAAAGILIDFKEKDDSVFSFRFLSRDIVSVMEMSGKILEYYIYYSALLEGHFDDVEMGWKFMHNTEKDSPNNELDVICTKGLSSLFISAKFGSQDKANKASIYNEISLLSKQFGLNAKAVLVMSCVDQFQSEKQRNPGEWNQDVKNAYNRGVYLLGKECLEDGILGQVLDRIAEGAEDWCDFIKEMKR